MTRIKVITGCTCSGKTAAAIEYALQNNAEIISCDSVQVYRGMDIGSAKTDKSELEKVRHHLIDVADVSEVFDVSKYVETAKAAMNDILSRGKNIVVAGGSGFYLKSWFKPVADNLPIDDSIRAVADEIELRGVSALADALLKIDPEAAKYIDMQNPRRTKNALQRCMASGKSVWQLLDEFAKLPCPFGELERDVELLTPTTEVLKANIEMRAKKMIESGLIDETKNLLKSGIEKNPAARTAIGYRETIEWIKSGATDKDALAELIAKNTVSLTKKQNKFLRFLNT